jgi:hypothetical protein
MLMAKVTGPLFTILHLFVYVISYCGSAYKSIKGSIKVF